MYITNVEKKLTLLAKETLQVLNRNCVSRQRMAHLGLIAVVNNRNTGFRKFCQ